MAAERRKLALSIVVVSGEDKIPPVVAVHGNSAREGNSGDAGDGGELVFNLLLNTGNLAVVGNVGFWNRDAKSLDAGGIGETRIDVS